MAERVLIVNADDFGLSRGVNAGVQKAHEQGIVTSAGLMVRGRAATEAAEYARATPSLSLGLHVETSPQTGLVASAGEWILTSRPSKTIEPPSGWCVPAMVLISVDFPAPLSPMIAVISLGYSSKSAPLSAITWP